MSMTKRMVKLPCVGVFCGLMLCLATTVSNAAESPDALAREILQATEVRGGLIVHLGCGDGKLTAALRPDDSALVQGLDTDAAKIAQAREHIRSLGLYGPVSVDRFDGKRLPYIDNLVNLVVAEDPGEVSSEEMTRVLCPGGMAYVKTGDRWTKTVKPHNAKTDEWTHYLHDASNNAVAHDAVVGPPRRMQWVGGPRYARHHDRMSSVNAVVSAAGRVFTIFDEAPPNSILTPPRWTLIARDAFNGVILWKRPLGNWHTHLWPLKSGPAQIPRRLVASGDRVYVTLKIDGPLVALDAVTGETVRTFDRSDTTEEVIFHDGTLFALVNDAEEKPDYDGSGRIGKAYGAKFWDEAPRKLVAIQADTGDVLWTIPTRVLPATLAADSSRVVFHDGESVVCLDRATGKQRWRSEPVARSREIRSFYLPILVLYKDIVLFSGGETAGLQTGSWYTSGEDTMTALSAEDGKPLWSAYHPPSGYRSPEDLLVADGLVWTGETTSGRAVGVFTGRDPATGEVKREFSPNVTPYWFHHRCYRGKATDKFLLMARAGTEFIDVRKETWTPHHWVRGACLYGVMPANGLLYAPQHPCACYLETKQYGFNALAPAASGPRILPAAAKVARVETGSALGNADIPLSEDWPTLRHDAARSGRASTSVPATLEEAWKTQLDGKLTAPVIAGGRVFVASIDTHTVHALDAASGKRLWHYTAGGRVDSPPTVHRGLVLFGSADGYVHALGSADGALAWRFRAAPMDQRLMSFEQVESVWPVHGSVLVRDGVLYCVAGRSMFLDGGLRLLRLDPMTGQLLSETVMGDREQGTDKDLHEFVSWLNMAPALPDVLSSEGKYVYMRSQPFALDGTRLPLEAMPSGADADAGAPPATQDPHHAHLFSPTGFLDDTWWHRTYWMYGSRFVSGWCGYYRSGKVAPSGRILVFDDSKIYGFGRKPQYYRWTTPIEHHLFAADKVPPNADVPADASAGGSRIRVEKSASLNPAGKPLSVEAWVKAEKPDGVVLAHGGGGIGYTVYLRGGRPHFAVRTAENLKTISAKEKITGRWVYLAAVLTADKRVQLYVDGKLAASGKSPALITADPHEGMEIGADEGSCVGDYTGPLGFTGLIDEVRVYHRGLDAAEIEKHTKIDGRWANDRAELVLSCTFDKGNAADASGNGNDGTPENVAAVKVTLKGPSTTVTGQAMKFTGRPGRLPGFNVDHHWTQDLPLLPRAMVLAGETLFLAGPADTIDEEQAFRAIADPKVSEDLAEQATIFEGNQGAVLRAVSVTGGDTLAEYPLEASPVFDGMAAAAGRLYITTTDGKVVCLGGK